jgi:hypothetical protein
VHGASEKNGEALRRTMTCNGLYMQMEGRYASEPRSSAES